MRRASRITLLVIAAAITGVVAAEPPSPVPPPSWDVRLSIIETRVARNEADLMTLRGVPTQLARMEATLQEVANRSMGTANVLVSFAVGVGITAAGAVIVGGRKNKGSGES